MEQGLCCESGDAAALGSAGRFALPDYELIEEIARGGMGVVYKARQLSLGRIVAVKMILSGQFASAAAMQRFRAEARATAALQHPGIVAIHEVGEHEGLLYFSMDLVEGQNLAQLIRDGPWPARRAAQCVRDVAEAIHYAHEHGVLHRDLKPSNVLIDTEGKPRVTDFGLAKRLTDSDGEAQNTELTVSGQVLGSPNFMPPEQAAGKHRELTPASDVYSLGALLYHLLTGRPPFLADNIPATLRLVAEIDPVAPRLLAPNVPRDLETTCLKCLEKDPRRRYATAKDLTDELGRFLRDEPIAARRANQLEKAWRWCRRKPALATAMFLVLLVAVASPIAALRINRERIRAEAGEKRAQVEAKKSQQVAQLLKEMLSGVGPSVALGRDTTMLREILDKTAERVGTDLKDQPEVELELRSILGAAYYQIGYWSQAEPMHRRALEIGRSLYGDEHVAVASSMFDLASALERLVVPGEPEKLHREALAIRQKLMGDNHPQVADSLSSLAGVLLNGHKLTEAESKLRQALSLHTAQRGSNSTQVIDSSQRLALLLGKQKRLTDAEMVQSQALSQIRALHGNSHPDVAIALNSLGVIFYDEGKFPEAEAVQREALELFRKYKRDGHVDSVNAFNNLILTLRMQGKLDEAEQFLNEVTPPAKEDQPSLPRSRPGSWLMRSRASWRLRDNRSSEAAADLAKLMEVRPDDALNWSLLAVVLAESGRTVEYRKHCQTMLARFGSTKDPAVAERTAKACLLVAPAGADLEAASRLAAAATVNKDDGARYWAHIAAALANYRQSHFASAAEWARKALSPPGSYYVRDVEASAVLAMACQQLKQPDQAHAALMKAIEGARVNLPGPNTTYFSWKVYEWLTAYILLREALTVQRHLLGSENPNVPESLSSMALLLQRQGRLAEAETMMHEVLTLRKKLFGDAHPDVTTSRQDLILLLLIEKKFSEAEPMARECLATSEKQMPDDVRTFNARSLLGGVLLGQKRYTEAEPLLLSGYEGMKKREGKIPAEGKPLMRKALQRMVPFYEATGQADKAADWKMKVGEFDIAEAAKKDTSR